MSIHADDEFSLRLAIDTELDDVTPRDGLADLVIARYRKSRRRRFAGVFGLFVVFAGIGVPIGIASTSGGTAARSGPVALRLGSYTLTLPDRYHLSDARTAPCAAGAGAGQETAAVASGVCVLMFFMPPARPGQAGPDVPRDAKQVTVGRYRAWLAPPGYTLSGDGPGLMNTALVIEGDGRGLVIGASGLPRSALVSLVSSGLSGTGGHELPSEPCLRLASIHIYPMKAARAVDLGESRGGRSIPSTEGPETSSASPTATPCCSPAPARSASWAAGSPRTASGRCR